MAADVEELEALVVRLLGDASSYLDMLREAGENTKKAADEVRRHGKGIEDFGASLKGYVQGVGGALASLGAVQYARQAFGAFEQREQTLFKLNAALESNGRNVEGLTKEYQDFATIMGRVTPTSSAATLALLQQAESMGLTGAEAERAVKNSIAMQYALGGEAQGHLHVAMAIEKGHVPLHGIFRTLSDIHDPMKRAAAAQELLNKQFAAATSAGKTTAGAIEQLQGAWKALLGDLGESIADGVRPLVQWVKEAVDWFRSLSKSAKESIGIILAVGAAAITLGGILTGILAVVNVMSGGIPIIVGAVVAAGVALAVWADRAGGLVKVWGQIKTAAMTAWAWIKENWRGLLAYLTFGLSEAVLLIVRNWDEIKGAALAVWDAISGKVSEFIDFAYPVWQAFASFVRGTWEAIQDGASVAWDKVKQAAVVVAGVVVAAWDKVRGFFADVWKYIAGDAEVNWTKVRDGIRDAFIFAEFVVRNFGRAAEIVWVGFKFRAAEAFNYVEYWFKDAAPAIIKWFGENWKKVFADTFEFITVAFSQLGENLANIAKNLPALISGDKEWKNVWKDLTKDAKAAFVDLPPLVIPRQLGALEKQWKAEYDALKDKFGQDYAAFREAKLKEFAEQRKAEGAAEKPPELPDLGKPWREARAAIERFDAALAHSAEAVNRIAEYRDMLAGASKHDRGGAAGAPMVAVQAGGADGLQRQAGQGEQNKLLADIRNELMQLNRKPPVVFEGADIANV